LVDKERNTGSISIGNSSIGEIAIRCEDDIIWKDKHINYRTPDSERDVIEHIDKYPRLIDGVTFWTTKRKQSKPAIFQGVVERENEIGKGIYTVFSIGNKNHPGQDLDINNIDVYNNLADVDITSFGEPSAFGYWAGLNGQAPKKAFVLKSRNYLPEIMVIDPRKIAPNSFAFGFVLQNEDVPYDILFFSDIMQYYYINTPLRRVLVKGTGVGIYDIHTLSQFPYSCKLEQDDIRENLLGLKERMIYKLNQYDDVWFLDFFSTKYLIDTESIGDMLVRTKDRMRIVGSKLICDNEINQELINICDGILERQKRYGNMDKKADELCDMLVPLLREERDARLFIEKHHDFNRSNNWEDMLIDINELVADAFDIHGDSSLIIKERLMNDPIYQYLYKNSQYCVMQKMIKPKPVIEPYQLSVFGED
jgi:hypothetical protein